MSEFESEMDVVEALESYLNAAPETEAPVPEAPKPETPEIQPQAAPEAEQTDDGVNDSEEAQAPAVETTAPVAAEAPKTNPETPKVEQRVVPEPSAPTEADAATNQALQRINGIVQQLEVTAAGKFSDLKSEADVLALMQSDPNRYNEFVIAQTQLNRARQAQGQAQQEATSAYRAAEQKKLEKALPDLADPEKGQALRDELRAYAKSQGIPDSRQARDADEVIRLHREMVMAKELKALKAEKATQAKALEEASKKAAKAPPVQQPGTPRDTNKNEKASTDFSRFEKSGRLDDLAAYLNHI